MIAAEKKAKSAAERMSSYRQRMRHEGLRPIQIWVPDLRKPDVLADYQRQARLIAKDDPAGEEALSSANLMPSRWRPSRLPSRCCWILPNANIRFFSLNCSNADSEPTLNWHEVYHGSGQQGQVRGMRRIPELAAMAASLAMRGKKG